MSVILVVDDQEANRDVLTSLLGYYKHRVFEAADGAEGLAVAARELPDLIISDVLMPAMDGYEFVRRLRLDPKLASKPVIFYTAYYLEKEALLLARKCGVAHVLRKPCEPADALAVIEAALGLPAHKAELPQEVANEHLELITTRLSRTADELGLVNMRLEALIEAGHKLATERDPARLVDQYASVTRRIVGAGLCVIGLLEKDGTEWSHVVASGFSEQAVAEIHTKWKPDAEDPRLDFCPENRLGIAIRTSNNFFGWLCVAAKLGGGAFTADDERLARTLAAQLAVAYENARLYADVRRHAAQLEERIADRTRDLATANQELEAFTFAVSHDLRAPLHHLRGFSSMLEEEFGNTLNPAASGLVQRIQRTSCEMAELVKNLLELSRLSKQEIEFNAVALDGLLKEAVEEVRRGDGNDSRALEWRIHPLGEVQGSRTLLKQVFINLLSNAVKFTGRKEAALIEVGEQTIDGQAVIYVRDNGAGFNSKHSDRLFGVFQRLHQQSDFPGTGAGLAIVQRIVNRHGGRIWAESTLGQGATFFFTLGGPVPAVV